MLAGAPTSGPAGRPSRRFVLAATALRYLALLLLLTPVTAGLSVIAARQAAPPEPEIVTQIVEVPRPVYIRVPVPTTVVVEVPVLVPVPLESGPAGLGAKGSAPSVELTTDAPSADETDLEGGGTSPLPEPLIAGREAEPAADGAVAGAGAGPPSDPESGPLVGAARPPEPAAESAPPAPAATAPAPPAIGRLADRLERHDNDNDNDDDDEREGRDRTNVPPLVGQAAPPPPPRPPVGGSGSVAPSDRDGRPEADDDNEPASWRRKIAAARALLEKLRAEHEESPDLAWREAELAALEARFERTTKSPETPTAELKGDRRDEVEQQLERHERAQLGESGDQTPDKPRIAALASPTTPSTAEAPTDSTSREKPDQQGDQPAEPASDGQDEPRAGPAAADPRNGRSQLDVVKPAQAERQAREAEKNARREKVASDKRALEVKVKPKKDDAKRDRRRH